MTYIKVMDTSAFVSKTLWDKKTQQSYEYFISKIFFTDSRNGRQLTMALVIDPTGNDYQIMYLSEYRLFLKTGDRYYLHIPNLNVD
jgi:hypothetical protein